MTNRVNIYINQGTDYQTFLEFRDDNGPVDITDYTFTAQIRKLYSEYKIADFTFIFEDAEKGLVKMYISDDETACLPEGKYQYDVLSLDMSNKVTKVLEGLIFIIPTITNIEEI